MPRAAELRRIVAAALEEDLAGYGDLTSLLLIEPGAQAQCQILVRRAGVVAGLPVAAEVFRAIDESCRFEGLFEDGCRVGEATTVARVRGPARALLAAERTALNFLGRLSGIATRTRAFVDAVAGTGATILATRKTTPGLRALEKYAVCCGGGSPHRFGLFDGILVKDNHRTLLGGLRPTLERLRKCGEWPMPIEVEVDTLEELDVALEFGVPLILLDNFSVSGLEEAVRRTQGRARLEASGGITLETVQAVARTGVDRISLGELTHSAPALDVSFELEPG